MDNEISNLEDQVNDLEERVLTLEESKLSIPTEFDRQILLDTVDDLRRTKAYFKKLIEGLITTLDIVAMNSTAPYGTLKYKIDCLRNEYESLCNEKEVKTNGH
jgi:hypothetical protein